MNKTSPSLFPRENQLKVKKNHQHKNNQRYTNVYYNDIRACVLSNFVFESKYKFALLLFVKGIFIVNTDISIIFFWEDYKYVVFILNEHYKLQEY